MRKLRDAVIVPISNLALDVTIVRDLFGGIEFADKNPHTFGEQQPACFTVRRWEQLEGGKPVSVLVLAPSRPIRAVWPEEGKFADVRFGTSSRPVIIRFDERDERPIYTCRVSLTPLHLFRHRYGARLILCHDPRGHLLEPHDDFGV